jgi:hypothetical protein
MMYICLPDNGNTTDILTERIRSAIPIRFAIWLCNLINGKRMDSGYESQILNFYAYLSLISLRLLTLTFVFIYYFNKFPYS